MSDISAFITAELDMEEAAARAATPGPWTAAPYVYGRPEDGWGNPEDGPWAINAPSAPVVTHQAHEGGGVEGGANARHIVLYGPQRVLADITARRTVIGDQTSDHAPVESMYGTVCRTCVNWLDSPDEDGETEFGIAMPQPWPCKVARAFAAPYSSRDGYDPAWAVTE